MNKTMINNRYYIKNKNKIEFVKKLADARLRGHEVIKIKTEKKCDQAQIEIIIPINAINIMKRVLSFYMSHC
ncbi:hypothetical protein BTTAP_10122 [Brochothrix thermosphacta]|uniref:hypothetical protein n=1 Tax=Brochothrix thermosphacta TaxID=2756 RepID=UPI000D7AC10B|nr:hypothetical protein [Brochothrix thermosphacta]SPP25712.1 hypothetical protein BTTAP_10122 [Brochothrix thermosphacta]